MESEIQKTKQKLLDDIDMYINKGIEDFSQVMTDISLKFLTKIKEREIELTNEIETLENKKTELSKYVDNAEEVAKDIQKQEADLDKREKEITINEKETNMIKEGVLADVKMVEAMKKDIQKQREAFEKEKQQFQVQKAMVEEQVKTLRKLNIE